MKQIPLSRGLFAIIDDEDFNVVSLYKWQAQKGRNGNFYAIHRNKRKILWMHWLIIGKPPEGFWTDHKNGNGLDNRRSNIRHCTPSQNHHNKSSMKKKNRTSNYKGVKFMKDGRPKPWHAYIERTHLGSFETEEQAAFVYNQAASKRFGPFAKLNNIPEMCNPRR